LHSELDCETNCSSSKCLKRHRKDCLNGNECYYFSIDKCEYKHNHNIIKKTNQKQDNKILNYQINELNDIINAQKNEIEEIHKKMNELLEKNAMLEIKGKQTLTAEFTAVKSSTAEFTAAKSSTAEFTHMPATNVIIKQPSKVILEDIRSQNMKLSNMPAAEKKEIKEKSETEKEVERIIAEMDENVLTDNISGNPKIVRKPNTSNETKHIKGNTDENYECNKCGKNEKHKDEMKKHMKKYHGK